MSFDGIVTMAAAEELREQLLLGKIEKIYQPQPEQLILSIHTRRGRRLLFLSAAGNHSAVYLVPKMTENPITPPVFCMLMRKHLGAARIVDIQQHENDRILEISLETVDEMGFSVNRKLIVEIMGKHSNILLIDMGTGRIIDSIKHVSIDVNRARQILPGKPYTYPPAQKKIPFSEVTEEDIRSMVTSPLQPERDLLAGIQGISPVVAQELASAGQRGAAQDPACGAQDGVFPGDDLPGGPAFDPAGSFALLQRICASIPAHETQPVVYLTEGRPVDFHITPLSVYRQDASYEEMRFDSFSEAAAYYFIHRESSNTLKQKSNDLQRVVKAALDKHRLKIQRLNEDLRKAENADRYRLFGELLTANLHLVKPGDRSITVTSYYDGAQVEIPLDPRWSASRNAQQYYKKYGKSRTAVKEKKLQLEETEKEIAYLENISSFVQRAISLEELELIRQELVEAGLIRFRRADKQRQRKAKPSPYRYTLSSGKTVLAGRNNKENDWLTLKRAAGSDLWFHTKDIPGTHVILLLEGQEPLEEDLAEAASIAAYHSKGSASSNVPVDYTKVRHVKKPAGAKPGMVIFTHNRTLYVEPKLP